MISNGMLSASHGLRALQTKVDTIANNIANSSATGYKSKDTVFGEILYQQLNNQPGGEAGGQEGRLTEEMVRRGAGIIVTATPTQFNQGMRLDTGNTSDLMIEGNGFFRVARDQNNDGAIEENDIRYTRNGAFQFSVVDDTMYLVTGNGEFVLDEDAQPITIEAGSSITILSNGMIVETTADGEETEVGRMGIYTFPNLQMLVRDGSSNWLLHPAADPNTNIPALVAESDYTIIQGAIEGSNVDMSKELTDLITAQRAMSMMGKALTMSDEMLGMANDLVRR